MKTIRHASKAIDKIPEHLLPYTTQQNPELYSPIDHSAWRFIMKLSADFFSKHAHPIYLDGLKATGISIERIPLVEEMDRALRKFGWRAVNVSGFIPPAAFLEFLALGILPIACEMRKVENINYTPAPDIVHEAAGHAPILADKEYASYVKAYGEIARKAIFSKKDLDLYEAIRLLSDVKEKPTSTQKEIENAQKGFEHAYAQLDYISEATQLARMSWWTIEYGLLGDLNKPHIYGAGLLSSLGESFHCFDENVKKIPFTEDSILQSYDITRPQPQLFVSPSVKQMKKILLDFSKTMAFKRGGTYGLGKAKTAESITTTVFENGLRVSGIVKNFSTDAKDQILFIHWEGPLQLSLVDKELKDWETSKLPHQIVSPLGSPASFKIGNKSGSQWNKIKWATLKGQSLEIHYKNGIQVKGKVSVTCCSKSHAYFVELTNAQIENPLTSSNKTFDRMLLILAKKVVSVFGGAADRAAYQRSIGFVPYKSNQHIANYDQSKFQDLYQAFSKLREFRSIKRADVKVLDSIIHLLSTKYPKEWLLRWELLELNALLDLKAPWKQQIQKEIEYIAKTDPHTKEAIQRGLDYLKRTTSKQESHLMPQVAHA